MKKAILFLVAVSLVVTVSAQQRKGITAQKRTTNSTQTVRSVGKCDPKYTGQKGDFLPFAVKFQPMQSMISQTGMKSVKDIAQFLKNHSDASIVVLGYAKEGKDARTCNMLAENRALAVKSALINNCGISPNRVIANSAGIDEGVAQMFAGSSDVVICYEQDFVSYSDYSAVYNEEANQLLGMFAGAMVSSMMDDSFGQVSCSYCNGTGSYNGELCPKCGGNRREFNEGKAWSDAGKHLDRAQRAAGGQAKSQASSAGQNGYQIKKYKDGVYEGYMVNGKRHGLGIFQYSEGNRFVGEWKNDLISGRGMSRSTLVAHRVGEIECNRTIAIYNGRAITSNEVVDWTSKDNIYIGPMDKGKYSGYGKMLYKDGSKYVGQWVRNERSGKGTLTYANGTRYVGEFLYDHIMGEGVKYYNNGNREEGRFGLSGLSGQGKYYWADGSTYVGEFKDDKFNGKGVRTWADGERYEGNFKDDKRHGYGVVTRSDGWTYKGQFSQNKMDGHGVETFSGGNTFEGRYSEGLRKWGIYKWSNGNVYVGDFKGGFLDGEGTMYSAENHQYIKGIRKEGQLIKTLEVGQYTDDDLKDKDGTITYPNGDVYVGRMRYGIPYSYGTYTWANGDKYVGDWNEGKRHGKGNFTWANGEKYSGTFQQNDMTGKGVKMWPNGERYEGEFLGGMRDGKGTMYYKNHKYKIGIWELDNLGRVTSEGKWTGDYEKKKK